MPGARLLPRMGNQKPNFEELLLSSGVLPALSGGPLMEQLITREEMRWQEEQHPKLHLQQIQEQVEWPWLPLVSWLSTRKSVEF